MLAFAKTRSYAIVKTEPRISRNSRSRGCCPVTVADVAAGVPATTVETTVAMDATTVTESLKPQGPAADAAAHRLEDPPNVRG